MDVADAFVQAIAGDTNYAMYVVTVAAGGERSGCLVGFTTQCSIDPPRFLVCLSRANRTFAVAERADALGVHLLAETDMQLARLFGERTGDDVDKFTLCAWREGPRGVPLLDGCERWFVGRVLGRVDLGDHCGFVLEPVAAEARSSPPPLTYRAVRHLEAGHDA